MLILDISKLISVFQEQLFCGIIQLFLLGMIQIIFARDFTLHSHSFSITIFLPLNIINQAYSSNDLYSIWLMNMGGGYKNN